ncbi:MAG: diaminopimelate decarboxylase [Oscillospiraceae bacterium]|nr:diaminopimelate decarboxylase [Oscillospiraceae bacterium]
MTVKPFLPECAGISETGSLTIGGVCALRLAEEFGTPLYVMDENEIRKNAQRFVKSINEHYGGRGLVSFASKAFMCKEMCRLAKSEGMGLDVVSAGELYTAIESGFPMRLVTFHGNNKTPEELTYAVSSRVGSIVVDNTFELHMLEQIAKSAGVTARIKLRIKPGVEAHTHELIMTGGIDSKFGFAIETGEALAAAAEALGMDHIELTGVHCHIGSQIFDIEPFEVTARIMLKFMNEVKTILGCELSELNLGGGFGIRYLPEDSPVPLEKYMESVARVIKETCGELNLNLPSIGIEPGRAVTGAAGITLYRVGAVKDIPGVRTYVTVDGGLTDNPRPALYGAKYAMTAANKMNQAQNKIYTVSGRCCETDQLGAQVTLQEINVGDILAVFSTGAYNYSMASNYNRLPKPAVVFVKDGEARVVVNRETLEDMARNDV